MFNLSFNLSFGFTQASLVDSLHFARYFRINKNPFFLPSVSLAREPTLTHLGLATLSGFNILNTLNMTTRTPTSSTASDNNAVTPMGNSKSKAHKPDLYHGDRKHTDIWLLQLDLYFFELDEQPEDKRKVIFAATYMRGDAGEWIQPYVTKYLEMDHDNEDEEYVDNHADAVDIIEDYANFKKHLKQMFGIANKVPIAARNIQTIMQRRSAAEYAAEFRKNAVQLDWDDESLMTMYKQGLKKPLREELLRSGGIVRTLDELYDESIRIDGEWFALQQEFQRNPRNVSFGRPAPVVYRVPPKGPRRQSRDSYGYQPMEDVQFNYLGKGKGKGPGFRKPNTRISDGTRHQGTETRTCFTCGKPGHIARNCRSKNKVIRQLNVLTVPTKEIEDEEWTITDAINDLTLDDESGSESSTDSRLYEDTEEEQSEAADEEVKRTPTPHPWFKGKEVIFTDRVNVWEYLDEPLTQPRDGDMSLLPTIISPLFSIPPEAYNRRRLEIVTKEDRQWADHRYARQDPNKHFCNENPDYSQKYYLDHRNPWHSNIRWIECGHDWCPTHYRAKELHGGKQPPNKQRCRWEWYDCPINKCDEHLWDKRERLYFPSMNDAQNVATSTLYNGTCTQDGWQTCLNIDCSRHWDDKCIYGFGKNPDQPRTVIDIHTEMSTAQKGEASEKKPWWKNNHGGRREGQEQKERRKGNTDYLAPKDSSFLDQILAPEAQETLEDPQTGKETPSES